MNEELESIKSDLQALNGELRQRTEEIQEVNTFMESVLANLQLGVVVVDAELRVRMWYGRLEELWGLKAAQAYGQPLSRLGLGVPRAEIEELVRSCLAREEGAHDLEVEMTNDRAIKWSARRHLRRDRAGGADCTAGPVRARRPCRRGASRQPGVCAHRGIPAPPLRRRRLTARPAG